MRLLVILAATSASLFGQCPGLAPAPGQPVPELRVTTELWASNGAVQIRQGEPNAPWLLGFDTQGPPAPAPPGLCLGLSADFQIILEGGTASSVLPRLDGNGSLSLPLAFPPSISLPTGTTWFLQAAVTGTNGVGLTNGVEWTFRSPTVVVARSVSTRRELEIYDGRQLATASGLSSGATLTNLGGVRVAFSGDGERLFVRDISNAFPNQVRAFDLTSNPPALAGTYSTATGAAATDRMGVVLREDDSEGYASYVNGTIEVFDADPSSATFMSGLGTITTTVTGPGPLALTEGDALLLTVPGSPPPVDPTSFMSIIDPTSRTELATAPLTDNAVLPLVGGASRGRIDVSPDNRLAATVSEGFFIAPGSPFGGASMGNISIVDIDAASATFGTEIASVNVAGFGTRDIVFSELDSSGSTLLYTETLPNGDVMLTELVWPGGGTVTRSLLLARGGGLSSSARNASMQTSADGRLIYVTVVPDRTLRVIDTATFTEISRTTVPAGGSVVEVNAEGR